MSRFLTAINKEERLITCLLIVWFKIPLWVTPWSGYLGRETPLSGIADPPGKWFSP